MRVLFIRNYKRKLLYLNLIILLWISMFFLSEFILSNSLIFKVTINNYLTFKYPFSIQVDNIYVHEQFESNVIQTNSTVKKPIMQKFNSFKSINGKFSFQYPSVFTIDQQDFTGTEILYHIDFQSKPQKAHGFVQVWKLPYSLKEFLDKSKQVSTQNYKYFSSKPVTVNGLPGYYWDYSSLGNDSKYYKGSEVFFTKNDKMYRISYFVPEEQWNKSQSDIFWNIVKSFKTY